MDCLLVDGHRGWTVPLDTRSTLCLPILAALLACAYGAPAYIVALARPTGWARYLAQPTPSGHSVARAFKQVVYTK